MAGDEVTVWIERIGSGDEAAAQAVWEKYFHDLVRLARRRLIDLPRRTFDEEDVALSAMNSMLRGVREGRFPKLEDRQDLWKLLVVITAGKIRDEKRRQTARKRGGGKVRGESAFGDDGIHAALGKYPTAKVAFVLSETCQELLSSLTEDGLQQVALLKMQGFTNEEIAEKIDRAITTVERRLNRIRNKWSEIQTR